MIIIKLMGGLGNQMQQYALYEKYKYLNIPAKLDKSWFEEKNHHKTDRKLELTKFKQIELDFCTQTEKNGLLSHNHIARKIVSKMVEQLKILYSEDTMYDPKLLQFQSKYLEGYWACEQYYGDIMKILQQRFEFSMNDNQQNINWMKQSENEDAISIHIRRGDYLNPENLELFGHIATEIYYREAINRIKKAVENPKFYIFTDDVEYAKRIYRGNEFSIIDWNQGEDSYFDMYLMSLCKHNICANSTFSIWGARLNQNNNKIMIRPLKHKNGIIINRKEVEKLWCDWVLIDENGV